MCSPSAGSLTPGATSVEPATGTTGAAEVVVSDGALDPAILSGCSMVLSINSVCIYVVVVDFLCPECGLWWSRKGKKKKIVGVVGRNWNLCWRSHYREGEEKLTT